MLGERGLTEVTSVSSRMRSVAVAATASVGSNPNQGSSRKLRRFRWSYVQAGLKPSC